MMGRLSEEMAFKPRPEEYCRSWPATTVGKHVGRATVCTKALCTKTLDFVFNRQQWSWGTDSRALAGCCMEKVVGVEGAGRPVRWRLMQ